MNEAAAYVQSMRTDEIFSRYEFEMPTGLPRPLYEGQPVPFTSDVREADACEWAPQFDDVDENRIHACRAEDFCLLCGVQVETIGFVIGNLRSMTVVDDGVMHRRCAKMALAHCPHFRADRHNEGFAIFFGPLVEMEPYSGLGRPIPQTWQLLTRETRELVSA